MEVTVLIPNYNGLKFLYDCIDCLKKQSIKDFRILVVDNASADGSVKWLKENNIDTLVLDKNYGFAGGVNAGIKEVDTAYTILLNNDTKADVYYVENLLKAIKAEEKVFSVSPMMIQAQDNNRIDDAGDGLCIIGFAYQIGVGELIKRYEKKMRYLQPVQELPYMIPPCLRSWEHLTRRILPILRTLTWVTGQGFTVTRTCMSQVLK